MPVQPVNWVPHPYDSLIVERVGSLAKRGPRDARKCPQNYEIKWNP
jgi:hypothetical protein